MSKKFLLIFTAVVITGINSGCSNKLNNTFFDPGLTQVNSAPKDPDPITVLVTLDMPPFISQQAAELSGIALMDDGKIIKYQTLKTANSFTATTTVYISKWVKLESHPTTTPEAQTILKLASQGGFAKEFKTLKERYEAIGIIDLK
jgi:hypothetical protein